MLTKAIDLGEASIWIDERDGIVHQIQLRGRVSSEETAPTLVSHSKLSEEIIEFLKGERFEFSKFNLFTGSSTPFQKRTWEALLEVPYGKTKTYGEIAQAIGSSRASRAIGNACGANPFPIIVPCHRIISANGNKGGFSSDCSWKNFLHKIEEIV